MKREDCLVVPQQVVWLSDFTPGYMFERTENRLSHKNICSLVNCSLTGVKRWKQPKGPPTDNK